MFKTFVSLLSGHASYIQLNLNYTIKRLHIQHTQRKEEVISIGISENINIFLLKFLIVTPVPKRDHLLSSA